VVADPVVYPTLIHGVTGLHATTPEEAREHLESLVTDPELRHRLGTAARAYVERERSMPAAAHRWAIALATVQPGAALAI
jgi:hypothetical protein